jgi:P-type Cu+ transporter
MAIYLCPMHSDVREANPGKCPTCHMDLVPEGAKFGMLHHMAKSPMVIAAMAAVMLVIMAFIMMR